MHLDDVAGAIQDFSEAEGKATDHVERWTYIHNRAVAKVEAGDAPGALADYTKILKETESAPDTAGSRKMRITALLSRGILYNKIARYQEANDDYGSIISSTDATDPDHLMALTYRALDRYRTGDIDGAIADYGQVIEHGKLSPRLEAKGRLNRGGMYFAIRDWNAAIADWTALLGLADATNEQRLKALINRGDARLRIGDNSGALQDYRQAFQSPLVPRAQKNELKDKIRNLKDGG